MEQLFVKDNQPPNEKFGGCALRGIQLGNDKYLANLGMMRSLGRHESSPVVMAAREADMWLQGQFF